MHSRPLLVKAIILCAVSVCLGVGLTRCDAKGDSPAIVRSTQAKADTPPDIQSTQPPAAKSIDALVDDESKVANHFGVAAEYSLLNGQVEQAIASSKRALRRDPDNIEAHALYAEALERKIEVSKSSDPELMRDCISEWLIVYRNEVGEEKGLGFHGISVLGHLYEDDGYAIRARQRLISIAGRAPKPWETNVRYLKSVLRQASVSGKIVSRK